MLTLKLMEERDFLIKRVGTPDSHLGKDKIKSLPHKKQENRGYLGWLRIWPLSLQQLRSPVRSLAQELPCTEGMSLKNKRYKRINCKWVRFKCKKMKPLNVLECRDLSYYPKYREQTVLDLSRLKTTKRNIWTLTES